jgi:AraC family transcriptional regulator, activator of mtrCDE
MHPNLEKIVHWVLAGLELKSTLFHVGQYCGGWQASTVGFERASFHVVLHGECWLHLPDDQRSVRLHEGDAVFLLRDLPHCLSPDPTRPAAGQPVERHGSMQPLDTSIAGSVGLACGFFEFQSTLGNLILSLLPDYLVVKRDDPALGGAHVIFDLIRAEAQKASAESSPLISRLTELLFFYALREVAVRDGAACSLWSLMRGKEFSQLVTAIIEAPGETWSADTMASYAHMSRARFFKRFVEVSGQPPAQFVAAVRMKVAAELLRAGWSIPRASEEVGYLSESAFAQAFKRMTGEQPGAYRRMHLVTDAQLADA